MLPTDTLADHFRLTKQQKAALSKLGVVTLSDLLFHFPHRYEDVGAASSIANIVPNETVTVYGELQKLEKKLSWRTKRYVIEAVLTDATGTIPIRWFNQPYIANMFEHVRFVKVTGKTTGTGKPYFANPTIEPMPGLPGQNLPKHNAENASASLFPVYPESKGITSRWFYHTIHKLLQDGVHERILDTLPETLRTRYSLPSLGTALVWVHTPHTHRDAQAARKRFSFEEVFVLQVAHQHARHETHKLSPPKVLANKKVLTEYVDSLGYTPTNAQKSAIEDIMKDFEKPYPMSRLLEGDVGSGKTTVAAATLYAIARGSVAGEPHAYAQVAYMAPTEILAKQQFRTLIEHFAHAPIPIALITSSGCQKFPSKVEATKPTKISRSQLTKWVANGEIPVVVGTHALIQKSVRFKNLSYVIIDEQHRFGTTQRKQLAQKHGATPHLLSMTATPIPRTLALALYGDLDLSVLDERPPGRKTIHTHVAAPDKRDEVYAAVRTELASGRQAYVICPRIDEPDPEKALALRARSVTAETARLQKGPFSDYVVGMVHGKMTPGEKEQAMKAFANGDTRVLVATSVIEVGVNVPNATVIIIEGAERFGLSQLHQLRGRVQRSEHQPYCYLFSESKTDTALLRLRALESAHDGFALAEEDLKLRGPGELAGSSQWGVSDMAMEALQNLKMVEAARKEAQALVKNDPELKAYPQLRMRMEKHATHLHME